MSNGIPNWSRALPRPLVIPKVMTLKTLADVRELIGHLPADRRALDTWRHVSKQLTQAAMTERRFPPPLIRQARLQPKASAHREFQSVGKMPSARLPRIVRVTISGSLSS